MTETTPPPPSDPVARRLIATVERRRREMIFNGDMEPPQEPFGAVLDRVWKEMKREWRRNASIYEAWCAYVPPELQAACKPDGLVSGVLTVLVPDDGYRFELDRELRMGLLNRLIGGSKAPLRRVKILVRPPTTRSLPPDREPPPGES